jgi:large subunit ribosomal protein L21
MNYAVIKASGKQYKVSNGLVLSVDKIEGEKGKDISFAEVLLLGDDTSTVIGKPVIKNALVTAKIVEQIKGDKVRVAKFKAKARFRRATGFRSQLTKIEITGIKGGTGK